MHFDDRNADRGDRVANRVRVVRVRAGIDDDAVASSFAPRAAHRSIAPSALCCSQRTSMPSLRRRGNDASFELGERLRAVDFRFAFAKQVEVRSVQNQNAHRPRFFGGKARASEPERAHARHARRRIESRCRHRARRRDHHRARRGDSRSTRSLADRHRGRRTPHDRRRALRRGPQRQRTHLAADRRRRPTWERWPPMRGCSTNAPSARAATLATAASSCRSTRAASSTSPARSVPDRCR